MRRKTVVVFMMAVLVAMLAGAGSGFAATKYFASVGNGGADLDIGNILNYFNASAGAGGAAAAFAEGDVLVFDAGSSVGALNLGTTANMTVGVTLKLDAGNGAVVIVPGHDILLSGIDMSTSADPLSINAGAGVVSLSAPANFITKAGQALTFIHALANGGFLLTISGDGTPLFQGGISGTGGLTLNMAGAQTVTFNTATATYTGDTTITKGNLTAGAVANMLTDDGTYILANDADAKITTGAVETIGSLSGGAASTVVMGAALDIKQTANTTYSGIISGSGPLRKIGAGTLKLAGANTYTAATNVDAGTLLINAVQGGACTGAVNVSNANTTLGGTGTINGAVTINSGAIVKPGDGGVGTLTATGTFTFAAGSKFIVDILMATSDLLAVTGALTITGGGGGAEIELGTVPSSLAMQYTVITAASGGAAFQTSGLTAGWSQTTAATFVKLNGVASGGAIPTFTEWGIILFGLLVATFAVWSIRRRKNYEAAA